MAGGTLKAVGGLFLVLGLLLLLGGIGAAIYGYMEDQEGSQGLGGTGLGQDGDRRETGQQLLALGAGAAAIGLVATLVSVILFSWGGARAQKALLRAAVVAAPQAPMPAAAAPVLTADGPRRIGPSAVLAGSIALAVLVLVAIIGGSAMLGWGGQGSDGGRLMGFMGGSSNPQGDATPSSFRFYPVFHSDVEGEGRYVLERAPDDVSMETRSTDGNVGNEWILGAPPTSPLVIQGGEAVRYHWVVSFEVAASVTFTAALALDAGSAVSEPETRTVAPGQTYEFDGVLAIPDGAQTTQQLAFTPTLEVDVGAPVFLVVTDVEESYLDVVLRV